MMDFQVSSLSAFVFFGGCRADAGRTSTRVFADASAYFLRASAARFWAVAAARRRAVSRAPVWKSTSESGAAVLPKSRGQMFHRHAIDATAVAQASRRWRAVHDSAAKFDLDADSHRVGVNSLTQSQFLEGSPVLNQSSSSLCGQTVGTAVGAYGAAVGVDVGGSDGAAVVGS